MRPVKQVVQGQKMMEGAQQALTCFSGLQLLLYDHLCQDGASAHVPPP